MRRTIIGWLFDVYPSPKGITVWFIGRDGERYRAFRPYRPSFFLHVNDSDARRVATLSARCPVHVSLGRATRKEIYSGDTWDVIQVYVHDTMRFKEAVRYFEQFLPHFAFYNSDILVAQLFLYETKLFPLALGEYDIDDVGELIGWRVNDSGSDFEYELPPFSMMSLRNGNDFVPPKYQKHFQIEIAYDGTTYALEQENPVEMLEALNWHLHRCDPDILLTEYGDSSLMPVIAALSQRHKIPSLLNRDQTVGYMT
ncbi:MAG: hypothetical protein WBW71_02935, partial [Bacteroidota bacterium]